MNGLGLSASKGTGAVKYVPDTQGQPLAYIEDDYFRSYNVEGGTLTFTENQTVDSTNNWLDIEFPNTAQNDISGISRKDAVDPYDAQSGFSYKITFSIFLEGANNWTEGAGNTEVTMKVSFGGVSNSFEVTPDTTESIDTGVQTITDGNQNNLIIFFNTENDLPEARAKFYIKSLDIQTAQDASDIT